MSQTGSADRQWLNKAFLEKVMRHYVNDDKAEVVEFTTRSGSKPGESFASDLLRVVINYASSDSVVPKSISVIVKTIPLRAEGDIDNERLFDTERKMYGETLIDINRVLLSLYDNVKLFPRLIYQSANPAVIILEDLSKSNFTALNEMPDYETSKMIFERLAVFHAASFYLREKGFDFSSFNYSVYHMPDSIQESFFRHNLRIFKSLVEENTWPSLNKAEYIERINGVIEKCSPRGQRVFSPTPGGFNVLNHGDFFLRNMLFQSIDGKICDMQFLDFQLSVYASPAVDIFMALYGSMTLKNRKTYRNEIILFYYETFVKSLNRLGYGKKPPTLNDLNLELMRNGALGAQICICYLPYLLAEYSEIDSNLFYNVNEDSENAKRILYRSEKFGEVITEEFEEFFYKGFI